MKAHVVRPLVYLAGPYSSQPVTNTNKAIHMAEDIQSSGLVTVVVPHLNLLWDMLCSHTDEYWYSYDLSLLARCDALLRIVGKSPGADNEISYAMEKHIPVFYESATLLE